MIALYARVSTDAQVEKFGLSSQLTELRKCASERYPGESVIELPDDGYTGAILDRPKLNELREMVRAKRVRVVLVYDPDRLSRELGHFLLLMDEIEKAGVRLDFVIGGFEQTPLGKMVMQMRDVIAQYEREQIKGRTQRGRLEAARQGRIPGGPVMFGYDRVSGALVINPSQAEVVRRIFSMLMAGDSVRAIVEKLNDAGIMPQRGARWRTSTVHRILRNRSYAGTTDYNRRKQSAAGETTFRPESEWIRIPTPAIIGMTTFERAQDQLKRNSECLSGRNDKRFYMLRGLLRCGLCGACLSGCASHGHRNYRCGGRDRLSGGTRCRSPWILSEKIETTVINAVRTVLKSGVLEAKLATHAPKTQAVDYAAAIAKIEREIETWRRTEERAARFLVAPEHAERQHVFQVELDRATKQRTSAEQRKTALEQARAAAGAEGQKSATVREICSALLQKLSRLSREQWRGVLQLLLDEITVTGRKLELRGILPAGDVAAIPSTMSARYGRRRRRPPEHVSR